MPVKQRQNGPLAEDAGSRGTNRRVAGDARSGATNRRAADDGRSAATNRRLAEDGRFGVLLDATNRRILEELQADARLSLAELGRRVGLSSPAVADRVQRLERDRVITGYRAEVDPRAVGYDLSAVIRIRPAPRQIPKVAALAQTIPEIVECHRITGEDCFFMKAHVRSVEHLEDVIDQLNVYGQTTTSIVQSSPVPGRGVHLGVPS
jgi:Lrp/AsnC family transcriptional regulator, leucine-responsive regulatory protein